MQYLVRTSDGKEYGPVGQEVLIQWAKAGRVTKDCIIRNSMIKKGNPASNVPFLKDIITKQINILDSNRPVTTKVKNLLSREEKEDLSQGQSLVQSGKFVAVSGTTDLRFGAWLIDTLILGIAGAGLLWASDYFIQYGVNEQLVFIFFSMAFLASILMYYTVLLGFSAQTIGQWIVGLMVIRSEGSPVLMCRAFMFSIFYILFFWTTVFFTFCLPSHRAIQDKLSGIRVVKIARD